MELNKTCVKCKESFDINSFYLKPAGKYGVGSKCKSCVNDDAKIWDNKNTQKRRDTKKKYQRLHKDVQRKYNLSTKYKMTIDYYNLMFEKQSGCCAICGVPGKDVVKGLVIDHCHKTNKVRELLCNKCNLGLGHLNDSIEIVIKALEYLKRNHRD